MRSLSRQERLVVLSVAGIFALGAATLLCSRLRPKVTQDLVVPWTVARSAGPSAGEEETFSGLENRALKDHLADVERRIESPAHGRSAGTEVRARRININTATEEELVLLGGIGPVRAKAIVEYRRAHGPFGSVEAVLEVRGIGPATLDRIRPWICSE